MSVRFALVTVALPVLLFASRARAADVPCGLAERGTVIVDGLLDDWQGVDGVGLAGNGRDATMTMHCNTDGKTVWLALVAEDDRLVRNRKPGPGDDAVSLGLARGKVRIFPAQPDYKIARKVAFTGKPWPIKVADGLTERGWALELAIPLAKLPGFQAGAPSVPLAITWADADLLSENAAQETFDPGESQLVFADRDAVFRGFLEQHKLRTSDVRLDTLADVDGARGKERIVWAGRVVGVLSDEAGYLVLPAQPKDVLEVRPVDTEGKGTSLIVCRWLEHGGGGSREVLAVFTARAGGLERLFAHEIAKKAGAVSLTNTVKWVPAGKRKKGKALEITVGEARGVTADTWREEPAGDMVPILLPWAEAKKERWEFADGEVSGGPVAARR